MTFLNKVLAAYKIEDLDEEEYKTLQWLSDRGYDAGILDALDGDEKEDGGYSFKPIPEHKAWEIMEAAEEQGFLTSNGSKTLAEKLRKFIDAIV